jgi:hypothetical protein
MIRKGLYPEPKYKMNAIDHSRVLNFSTSGSYSEYPHPHPLEYHPHSSHVVIRAVCFWERCYTGNLNGSVFTVATEFDTVAVWARQRAGVANLGSYPSDDGVSGEAGNTDEGDHSARRIQDNHLDPVFLNRQLVVGWCCIHDNTAHLSLHSHLTPVNKLCGLVSHTPFCENCPIYILRNGMQLKEVAAFVGSRDVLSLTSYRTRLLKDWRKDRKDKYIVWLRADVAASRAVPLDARV